MKKLALLLGLGLVCLSLASAHASTVVFTNNTAISPVNTSYDGADIVASNCTVTVDGAHVFNSVLVGAGGVLTHTFLPGGGATVSVNVTNELQLLDGPFPASLLNPNITGLVMVTDTNNLVTYSNGVDYIQTNLSNGTTQIYLTTNSAIPGNGYVYVDYAWSYSYNTGLYLTVSNDVTVTAGGSINANGVGYGPALGPGAGQNSHGPIGGTYYDGAGAGHGGSGNDSSKFAAGGVPYDSVYQPAALGSGGGASYAGGGGNGGGLIQINAGGNVDIEGLVSANGAGATNARAGGGAGGGIWISAATFLGAGSLTVIGGTGEGTYGGGGGGGRISIQCGTNNFSGRFAAGGGADSLADGLQAGGAGSIFMQTNGQTGLLLVDNGGRAGSYSADNLTTSADVVVTNGALLEFNYFSFNPRNVTIATNGTLIGAPLSQAVLNVTGNLIIQAGGALRSNFGTPSGIGAAPGNDYSGGVPYPCGGGGHGGYGGAGSITNANGGGSYDSQTAPTAPGSGGGNYTISSGTSVGGFGGGALQLNITGTLQVDGLISVNGGNGAGTGGGGGSGGSLYVANCSTFAGAGNITANGGNGVPGVGGGGGGGRIAIISSASTFTGSLSAVGGSGANYGGAGTIYLQTGSVIGPPPVPQLILDNGGNLGNLTPVQSGSSTALTIRNAARGTATSTVSFNSLLVSSNGWLTHTPSSSLTLTIASNATIQAGGGFLGDSLGKGGGQGLGAGGNYPSSSPDYPCGGGGYGGVGGNALTNAASGGASIGDSAASPSSVYSGSGGGTLSPDSLGGSGGGFLAMTVSGTLQMNGLISANGGNGSGLGGGGGAGGGVYLSAGTLTGGGVINVNGGAGANGFGGGGGGGRIALYFNSNNFTGMLSASGGGGANYGGAGTIYLKTNFINHAQIIVDNAGHPGPGTPWGSPATTTDLILRNGGSTYLSGSLFFGNITVGTNSVLLASNSSSPSSVTITANNVTVQPGGAISGDTAGYNPGNGNSPGGYFGNSPYYPGGGGGHGGYGAMSVASQANGGTYYDSASSPSTAGSGGGGPNSNTSLGGRGGGVIFLNLSGYLQVDGALSANGGNGSGAGGGGGAGGVVSISCYALAGAGNIVANGGNGVSGVGGGGAGGMIRASFTSNLFSGSIAASGGGGANYGGAGTIYFQTNGSQSLLMVDNGGHRGTNTPLSFANNYILRNGATAFQTTVPTITSLLITSNAWLLTGNSIGIGNVNLTVSGNATIQAGGGILADASGSGQNSGSGRGFFGGAPFYPCGGGGHGGYGAAGYTNQSAGGSTYDTSTSPAILGSGGGGTANSTGGAGGGYVRLTVFGTLQLNGNITANGGNGGGSAGGGGSGGSIYLAPGVITGAGMISANGGNGANGYGGGGGGGRIAVNFNSNTFTGSISAFGGGGSGYGGAGTIYTKTNTQNLGQLLLDNNNNAGTNTTFDFNNLDVTIQHQAVGLLPSTGSWSPRNVVIRTNSALAAPQSSSSRSINAANITIDPGGALTLDSAGSPAQSGAGSGYSSPNLMRGGGGHGGYGGGDPSGYGQAYDSILVPITPGSGGGSYPAPPYDQGGAGGGAITLTVSSTLTVNGRLSANGGNGDNYAGGGSGGSLYLPGLNNLAGSGVISVNGGSAGNGSVGGGGGGRIALYPTTSTFTGQITAHGGNGFLPGGAGTIYMRTNAVSTLLVDNGGISGTNTPVGGSFTLPNSSFDLDISGGATVVPLSPLPLLNNLNVAASSTLTVPVIQSNLVIAVQNNANIAGDIVVDNLGYAQTNGPGAGSAISSEGSGGGYGGAGGNSSSGAPGGTTYGSSPMPVDFGSGGGNGINTITGGSEGGGAIRLSVGGTLNLNGILSANGDFGWQDYSGGGAGGSLWITANTLAGAGAISVAGGNGDPAAGGGGGGGRIAIYCPTNLFAGTTNAGGGLGANDGQPGTVFLSSTMADFLVSSQSPVGTVTNTVGYLDLNFNEALAPALAPLFGTNFTLTTPAGVVPAADMEAIVTSAATMRVYFPLQNLNGNYSLQVGTAITNLFGLPLAQNYTGNFSISLPVISGAVTDTNGAPVAGVTLQPDGGLPASTSDVNGNYSIGVPPGWNGTVTPSFGTFMFVPHALTYTNITASVTNQNYLIVPTIAPNLASSLSNANLLLGWSGIPGVSYQVWSSPDLINWSPYGSAIAGTNGLFQVLVPITNSPALFLRVGASN